MKAHHIMFETSTGLKICEWAFGKGHRKQSFFQIPSLWNKRHGKIHMIKPGDTPAQSIDKIYQLWEKHMSKKKAPKNMKARNPKQGSIVKSGIVRGKANQLPDCSGVGFTGLVARVVRLEKLLASYDKQLQELPSLNKRVNTQNVALSVVQREVGRLVKIEGDTSKATKTLLKVCEVNDKHIKTLYKRITDMCKKISKPKAAPKVVKKIPKSGPVKVKRVPSVNDKLPKNFGVVF